MPTKWTTGEAAKAWGVSTSTVKKWLAQGRVLNVSHFALGARRVTFIEIGTPRPAPAARGELVAQGIDPRASNRGPRTKAERASRGLPPRKGRAG